MDWLPAVKLALAFVVLLLASWSDWRAREASDLHWIVLGVAGMGFLAAQIILDGADLLYLAILVPIAIFFLDIFWDRPGMFEGGVHALPLALYLAGFAVLAVLVALRYDKLYLWELMLVPILFLLFILLYQFDVIKGGADAKALIALAILFPLYPVIDGLPLIALPSELSQFVLPFPMLVLFNAALATLVMPVAFILYNLVKGDVGLPMLFGYRVAVDDAQGRFVWPMERMVGGERRVTYFPKSSEDTAAQLEELRSAGAGEIWVTPKLPFLIPITASLVFSAVVGNLFFLLMR